MRRSSATAQAGAAPWPDDAVEVGRVIDAWGVKGWIKVQSYAPEPQALLAARQWFLKPAEAATVASPLRATLPEMLHVVQARLHAGGVVAGTVELAERGAAEALRGAAVFVSRSCFPAAEPDEFYWQDLIGMSVRNRAGLLLGTVAGLLDTGAHSVLRVVPDAGASDADERLIPFVAAYIDDVSLEQRRIDVDWSLDY